MRRVNNIVKSDVLKLLRNPYFQILLKSFDPRICSNLIELVKNVEFNYVRYSDIVSFKSINDFGLLKDLFLDSIETGFDLIQLDRK